MELRTNGDYFPILPYVLLLYYAHGLTGFYNRDAECLLCGTNCIFKYKSVKRKPKEGRCDTERGRCLLCAGEEGEYHILLKYPEILRTRQEVLKSK
jgi:hypothetical protein